MEGSVQLEDPAMRALLRPRSVAILGCSENFARINGRPLKYFLENKFKGQIFPINPKYRSIAGLRCYADIREVPEPVDLAVVAVPAQAVLESVRALIEKGTPAAVVLSSGFAETGPIGAALQRELVAVARAGGLRLCGPNAVGVLNAFEGVTATFSEYLEEPILPGPVGFVSQSGAFGTGIAALARERKLGLGYFVNTGNESDIDISDALRFFVEDERIHVVAGYLEGIRDGRKLLSVADRAAALGKPLILTKVGRSSAGARAAASHTGALAGSDALFDDMFRQHGIIRARDEEEMLDFIEMFCRCTPPRGRNVCVVTQSGGAGVLACDRGEELGLEFPALGDATRSRLREVLPGYASVSNPVDVTGLSLAEPEIMRASMKIILDDPQIDIGVLWVRLMSGHVDLMLDILEDIRRSTDKTFVICWVSPPQIALERLRSDGFCVARGAAQAMNAVAALVRYAAIGKARSERSGASQVTGVMPSAVPIATEAFALVPTLEAAEILRGAGIPLIPAELARSAEEAVSIASRLGFPVALKIESPDILHKTDVGGVRLNLGTATELRAAFDEMMQTIGAAAPEARRVGAIVQPMAGRGVELVVGVNSDAAFGPVLMVGLGGIFVEILKDVQFRTAPVTRDEAAEMLSGLRATAMLSGLRGMPSINKGKLCDFLVAVSEMAFSRWGSLQSLDLNPVVATRDEVIAVDWLMIATGDGEDAQKKYSSNSAAITKEV